MKKFLFTLILGTLLIGCSNGNSGGGGSINNNDDYVFRYYNVGEYVNNEYKSESLASLKKDGTYEYLFNYFKNVSDSDVSVNWEIEHTMEITAKFNEDVSAMYKDFFDENKYISQNGYLCDLETQEAVVIKDGVKQDINDLKFHLVFIIGVNEEHTSFNVSVGSGYAYMQDSEKKTFDSLSFEVVFDKETQSYKSKYDSSEIPITEKIEFDNPWK